jgi:hypothetical protein
VSDVVEAGVLPKVEVKVGVIGKERDTHNKYNRKSFDNRKNSEREMVKPQVVTVRVLCKHSH